MKKDYKKESDESLRKQLQNNKLSISKSYGMMGNPESKGSAKEGVSRRLRKDNARILTELNRRKNGNKTSS